jgi:hypothetical protein
MHRTAISLKQVLVQESIPSLQTQVNIGYTHRHMQLETGLGYLVTGVSFISNGGGGCMPGPNPNNRNKNTNPIKYTITNPHIAIPVIISYSSNGKSKLSLSPGIGMEALYNFKGKMTTNAQADQSMNVTHYDYNNFGAAILVKCDVQYKLSNCLSVWVSPSYQNMLSSLITNIPGDNMSRVYDRAFLLNTGVKYNLQHSKKQSEKAK